MPRRRTVAGSGGQADFLKSGPFADAVRSIGQALNDGKHIDLFCDYDGVLSAIAPRPEEARIDERTQNILVQLSSRDALHLGIVSGRALADIRARVGIQGIVYIGNHGCEIDGPGILRNIQSVPERALASLRTILKQLQRAMRSYPGVIIEDKTFTVAVHFRLAAREQVPLILRDFSTVVSDQKTDHLLCVTAGKEVVEVRPCAAWDKGQAVAWLLRERHGIDWRRKALPVFLGDDKTDEDAFRLLRDQGITIRVGSESPEGTTAHYTLQNPDEVRVFLEWLLHSLS